MMAAFSRLIMSEGRFSFFHLAWIVSVVRILRGAVLGVIGIYR